VTLFTAEYTGRLARINEWHGATCSSGRARIFETTNYRARKKDLAEFLALQPHPHLIVGAIDIELTMCLYRLTDTDAPIKALLDALEDARIIENDRQIRNMTVIRSDHKRGQEDSLIIVILGLTADQLAQRET